MIELLIAILSILLTVVLARQWRIMHTLGTRIDTTNERIDTITRDLNKRIDATNERIECSSYQIASHTSRGTKLEATSLRPDIERRGGSGLGHPQPQRSN